MGCLGNLLWFIFGGCISGLSWCLAGCLWCITIIGIPVGLQCFKFASLSFFPFGKEVSYGGGAGSLILNKMCIRDRYSYRKPSSLQKSRKEWIRTVYGI